jgi:alpha-galactosidase
MKITFVGAGSTVFVKNIIGDCLLTEPLCDATVALYDIDAQRLQESKAMLDTLNGNINAGRAGIETYLGTEARKEALRDADFVVNAIQVGGYEPSTVIDFEVPKKYGLRQTIADTLGIGGIFRALRTIPVMLDFAREMEEVAPDAWLLNYTNPMAMVTGAVLHHTGVRAVGLCHSVQGCVPHLLQKLGMEQDPAATGWRIAGINHQAWLLELSAAGADLYPEVKRRAAEMNRAARAGKEKHTDMVRFEMMRHFGYYVTESSEHSAEYFPYWIKSTHPELVEEFGIPLDEYLRRCIVQLERWRTQSTTMVGNPDLSHERSVEYGSRIMEAIVTDSPYRIHGNILNDGFIGNLPRAACVEVPSLVDRNGVQGCVVGDLPEQCAALNRTNINVQLLTVEAALTRRRDHVYQAAMLDPHTASELTLDQIVSLCDDLIEAHGDLLPVYRNNGA